jgi:hypothetical protein
MKDAINQSAMNKSNQLIFQILAAGAAGVALFFFANAPFTAALRGDVILGIGASVALLAFAAYDYSRRIRSLAPTARLLRPNLPAITITRANACVTGNNRKDGLAA